MKRKTKVWIGGSALACGLAIVAAVFLLGRGEPPAPGGPATMRLISADQYRNAIEYVFGDDIEINANFPLLQRRDGLVSLASTTAAMTPSAFDQFDRAARSIAAQVVDPDHRATLIPCTPRAADGPDSACARQFFTRVGRLLYRRPLTDAELSAQISLASMAAADRGDFYQGLAYGLGGMLTSPQFLYISEVSEPDPDAKGQLRLDGYSKASRLSLFLWNAPPDDALLAAAEAGDLHDRKGLARQIDRMLASPRLQQGMRGFFYDLLQFQDFESISKDPVIYPTFTFAASREVHEQALRMIVDHLLVRKADYRDLFTTNQTFVNRDLAPLYQTTAASDSGDGWAPHELDRDRSAGVLTSLSFLAAHSHPGRSSPTLRGKAMREIFLCQRVPDPPPTVNFTLFENLSGKLTARDRLKAHVVDSACSGCHKLTDPIGLGFENFDGAGQFRTTENKAVIDTSGAFDGKQFGGAAEVGKAMHDHPALAPCLTRRLYAHGVGREPGVADRKWLGWAGKRFAAEHYRLPDLLRDIATSPAFFAVSESEDDSVSTTAADSAAGG